jgi:hypothetical protein
MPAYHVRIYTRCSAAPAMAEADPGDGEPLVLTADERTGTGPAVAAEARRFPLPVSAAARPSQILGKLDPQPSASAGRRCGQPWYLLTVEAAGDDERLSRPVCRGVRASHLSHPGCGIKARTVDQNRARH